MTKSTVLCKHIGLNSVCLELIFSKELSYSVMTMSSKGIVVPNSYKGHLKLSPTTPNKSEVLSVS